MRYDPATDPAPRVVAAGFGAMAEAILRRAREAGVVHVTSPLAPVLARIPPGQAVPPALFEVVAEIMALALALDEQMAAGSEGRPVAPTPPASPPAEPGSPGAGSPAAPAGPAGRTRRDPQGRGLAARWGLDGEPGSTRGDAREARQGGGR
ncbi:EscU/YscU/HrcU family type III secretion system export apparatus switch protein [Thermaerobacter litoralis]